MSLVALSEAWAKSNAEGATLLILLAIGDNADHEGVAFPSEALLAAKGRVSVRSVRRHIVRLKELNELEVWEWFDKTHRKRNCYRVLVGDFSSFRGIEPQAIRSKATILRIQIPTATRREVFDRDGWKCVQCESRDLLTIDHIIPVSKGGGNEVTNLRTLCRGCNSHKSDRTDWPLVEGTTVSSLDRTDVSSPARASQTGESLEPSKEPRRDLLFEAVADACGIEWRGLMTDTSRKVIGRCVKELRAAEVQPDEVPRRAAEYHRLFKDAPLTPSALAKHWPALRPAKGWSEPDPDAQLQRDLERERRRLEAANS